MDKQTIEQAAQQYFNVKNVTHNEWVDIPAAFVAGAELGMPKWMPTNSGVPQLSDPDSASDHIHCLVVRNGDIELLAWNIYHVCWDDADMDDYCCDLHDVTMYMPLYSLPNPTT
jgi:hypothetical protein